MNKKSTGSEAKNRIQQLVYLGLTNLEAKVYLLLTELSPLSIKDISQQLNVMTSSVHRTIKALKNKGFIMSHGTRALKIRAVDPSIALPNYIETSQTQKLKVAQELDSFLKKHTHPEELRVEFLESKQAAFEHDIDVVNNTKESVMIFSVGEPIPEELFLSFVHAIQRGVKVKMIAQKYTKTNKELLENWVKNGYKVRHINMPELDFTLVVYDKKISELHIRVPDNPNDRVGIVIHNSNYAAAQYQYLIGLWDKAKDISQT